MKPECYGFINQQSKDTNQAGSCFTGKITVNDNGSDSWNSNQQGQYYLAEQLTPKATEDYINHLIQHQPVKK